MVVVWVGWAAWTCSAFALLHLMTLCSHQNQSVKEEGEIGLPKEGGK